MHFARYESEGFFDEMIAGGKMPAEISRDLGLLAVTDNSAIEAWVDEAIAGNPEAVAGIKEGGKKLKKSFSFLMGQVMRRMKGRADSKVIIEILSEKLK